jgi:hypothetical protein
MNRYFHVLKSHSTFVVYGAEIFRKSRTCLQRLDSRIEKKASTMLRAYKINSSGRSSSLVSSESAKQIQHILKFITCHLNTAQHVVCFLLGNSPASEFYMRTFRNTLFHLNRQVGKLLLFTYLPMKMEQSVPKRPHIKFRRRGIT